MTDALAEWFLKETEKGHTPWRELAELTKDSFITWVEAQRHDRTLKNDDVTWLVLE